MNSRGDDFWIFSLFKCGNELEFWTGSKLLWPDAMGLAFLNCVSNSVWLIFGHLFRVSIFSVFFDGA